MTDPFPGSLCHRCLWLQIVRGPRSAFLMCRSPAIAVKYPPQPVVACAAFEQRQNSGS